jgi:ATP synthase protein I
MRQNDYIEIAKYLGLVTEVGLTMVASIAVSAAIGYYIDTKAHQFPLWSLIFLMLGIASGFWTVYKRIMSKIK